MTSGKENNGGQLVVTPCLGDFLGSGEVRFERWYVERQ